MNKKSKKRLIPETIAIRPVRLLCFLFLSLSPPITFSHIIHIINKNDSTPLLEKTYRDYLQKKSLIEVNPQLEKIIYIKNKELIVNYRVKVSYCSHTVRKGEWLAKIIRRYGYKMPYSLGLIPFAVRINSLIKNPNLIITGDKIHIPIIYIKKNGAVFRDGQSCSRLLTTHNKNFFLVRKNKGHYQGKEGKIFFHPNYAFKKKKQKLAQEKYKTISTKKHASESDPENQKNKKNTRPSSIQQKKQKLAQEKYKTISTKKHASESDPENQKNKKNTRPSSIQQKKQKLAQEKYKTISTKKHASESDPENQKNKKKYPAIIHPAKETKIGPRKI